MKRFFFLVPAPQTFSAPKEKKKKLREKEKEKIPRRLKTKTADSETRKTTIKIAGRRSSPEKHTCLPRAETARQTAERMPFSRPAYGDPSPDVPPNSNKPL